MPFVLVASRPDLGKKPHAADQDRLADSLLNVGAGVLRLLEASFQPESFKVWQSFPGEGLGGTLDSQASRPVRMADLAAAGMPTEAEGKGDFRNPLGLGGGVKLHHIVEIHGAFSPTQEVRVPATLWLNLSRAWSDSQGDVVFETFNTAANQNEGLADLLRKHRQAVEPFLFSLMRGVSKLNHENAAIRVRWAAIKDSEGVEEGRDFLVLYRHYETSLKPMLSEALEQRIYVRYASTFLTDSAAGAVATPAYQAVVRDLVREMGETRDFGTALGNLQREFGVETAAVGSVILTSWSPGAVDRMAEYVLGELGTARLRDALKARMGHVSDWNTEFARMAAKRGQRPVDH
jgi:hypothetical protein